MAKIKRSTEGSRLYIATCASDSDPERSYSVTIRRGQWECACRGWTMHVPRRDCKHIRRLKEALATVKTNLAGEKYLQSQGFYVQADWYAFVKYLQKSVKDTDLQAQPSIAKRAKIVLDILKPAPKEEPPEAPAEDWESLVATLRAIAPTGWAK